jgi:hypothetical protein
MGDVLSEPHYSLSLKFMPGLEDTISPIDIFFLLIIIPLKYLGKQWISGHYPAVNSHIERIRRYPIIQFFHIIIKPVVPSPYFSAHV